jgi:hypothetical protein
VGGTLLRPGALTARQAGNRKLGLLLLAIVAAAVIGGGIYWVYLANNQPAQTPLPAPPPRAQLLGSRSQTDILEANFLVTSALYRTPLSPKEVVAFYTHLLRAKHQIGQFIDTATTILPSRAPEALQSMPPIFTSPTSADKDAARYVYTEYHVDQSDIGIAVDTRQSHGPTLVYMEMLTTSN